MDPFVDAMTLSQATSYVYRKLFMPEDTIGVIPPTGYRSGVRHSHKSILWLEYQARERGVRIQHGRNGGEKYMTGEGVHVDGYVSPDRNSGKAMIFEFLGT